MPSVYDFHHIELDKVGRGKRRISVNTTSASTIKDVLCTPAGDKTDSRTVTRRSLHSSDTKNRLFGTPNAGQKRIITPTVVTPPATPLNGTPATTPTKKVGAVRRNPITGEVQNNVAVTPTNGSMSGLSEAIAARSGQSLSPADSMSSVSSMSSPAPSM